MAFRSILHKNRLEAFRKWANGKGYTEEPVKGDYEVLRLRCPISHSLFLFFDRNRGDHFTCQDNGKNLVRRFIADSRISREPKDEKEDV